MLQAFDIVKAIQKQPPMDVVVTYIDSESHQFSQSQILYREEYELIIRRGTLFSGRKAVTWDEINKLPLCLFAPDNPLFGPKESEILKSALCRTPHVITNAIWLLMDHVRSGNWATVLPRSARIMVAADNKLEAIALPPTGTARVVGIALPQRNSPCVLSRTFFEIATSEEVLGRLQKILSPNGFEKANPRVSKRRPS